MHKNEIPADMNPGIRKLVAWLWSQGFDTCDSGDGETHEYGCDHVFPFIAVRVSCPEVLVLETRRLVALFEDHGHKAQIIETPEESLEGKLVIEANFSPACIEMPATILVMGLADRHCPWLPAEAPLAN
jgi:hypothetical protein